MSIEDTAANSEALAQSLNDIPTVVSHILTPGSSLHPTFLLVVDGVFVFLLLVLFSLLIVTGGNLHFVALICITSALWASVKWFVHELRQPILQTTSAKDLIEESHTKKTKKDK
ncbi:hypothetical protein K439DRAFT_1610191 [Ramaria rubella]|nr:hypothetical protein K439DRAFT_1610191 [Ramaria rubella]